MSTPENDESLEACREQRTDLLELLEVEREQHAAALIQAWDEGVVAAHRSDLTLFAIKQVNPYRERPTPPDAPAGGEG